MESSIWPLILLIVAFLFALGAIIGTLEKTQVMKNWDKRRCNVPVMFAAMFFKPKQDTRSSTQFAIDNFEFCMKSIVEDTIKLAFAPIETLFGKQMQNMDTASSSVNNIRQITANMYNSFLSFIEPYFKRFTESVYELSRISQYLRQAFRRANAVMLSMLYTGLSMVKGMQNMISFVIKVIMIILGVLLALIIILFFVLFPVIPLILSVITAIVAVATGSTAAAAASMRSGFCFSKDTLISVKTANNTEHIPVSEIKIGQELSHNFGKITSIIKMNGRGVRMYNMNGIIVSGSHVVLSENNEWKLVAQDERAELTDKECDILYCFNTTTHNLPIVSRNEIIIFRDWDELYDEDIKGIYEWNYIILKQLNNNKNYDKWKDSINKDDNLAVSTNTLVKVKNGYTAISEITIGDIILDSLDNESEVLGTIDIEIDGASCPCTDKLWKTQLFEWDSFTRTWIRGNSNINYSKNNSNTNKLLGKMLITECGLFVIMNEKGEAKIIRDYTEIGYNNIHKTYAYVSERLRSL